jgi:hypothetical protein
MMGYQVLDRPEGTYGYNPGFMQNVTSAAKALEDWMKKQEKKKKDAAIREAIKNEQLTPKYEYDSATGEWKESWEKPKVKEPKEQSFIKDLLSGLAGLKPMEEIMPKETIQQVSPLSVGQAEGGEVLTPPGATYKDGIIYDPQGNKIGEYLPGQEPKAQPAAVPDIMRQNLGVTQGELVRKIFGLPAQAKKEGEITKVQAINILSDPMKAENLRSKYPEYYKKLEQIAGMSGVATEKEFTDEQKQLIQDNLNAYPDKTREEIIEALQKRGYL